MADHTQALGDPALRQKRVHSPLRCHSPQADFWASRRQIDLEFQLHQSCEGTGDKIEEHHTQGLRNLQQRPTTEKSATRNTI